MRCRICLKDDEHDQNLTRKDRACIRRCLRSTVRIMAGDRKYAARIDVTIVDDDEMRKINRKTRGIDKTTDVLSFPAIDFPNSEKPRADHKDGKVFLGDILIYEIYYTADFICGRRHRNG